MPPSGAAVRITHPYLNGVDRIVRAWGLYCKKIAVYQHDDDGANNLHCHIHLEGFVCGIKRLQQLAKETGVPLQKKGENGKRATSLMAFRQAEYDFHPSGYAYLTKGKYDPKYLQGFTKEETDVWKTTWVPPAEHVKETIWKKDNDKFKLIMPPKPTVDWMALDVPDAQKLAKDYFDCIVSQARSYVFKACGCSWPPQAKARLSNLVITWCMETRTKIHPF